MGREKSGKKRLRSKNKERKTIGTNHTVNHGVKMKVRYTEEGGRVGMTRGKRWEGGNLN